SLIEELSSHYIPVTGSDGSVLICPCIPDMGVKIMDIVGFSLIDPEDLVHTGFQSGLSQRQRRKFFSQVITVHYPESLNGVGCLPGILPVRPDLLSLGIRTVLQNIPAHINKKLVCQTHSLFLL